MRDCVKENERICKGKEKVLWNYTSGAFVLDNQSEQLDTYELIAVVMGVHAINKRRNSAASSGGT